MNDNLGMKLENKSITSSVSLASVDVMIRMKENEIVQLR